MRHAKVKINETVLECAVAESEVESAWGLRNQLHQMPDNQGMLFLMDGSQYAEMHMSGMSIPIDMVFVGADSRIKRVAEAASPLRGDVIGCQGVGAVIEVASGSCRRNGFKVGDLVSI